MSEQDEQTRRNLAAIQAIREENGWEKPEPEPIWYQVVTRGRNA